MALILYGKTCHKQGEQGTAEQGREFGGEGESVHLRDLQVWRRQALALCRWNNNTAQAAGIPSTLRK